MKVTKSAKFLALVLCAFNLIVSAQNVTVSKSGDQGFSGKNWTVSGENSIVISAKENAVIHPSVIEYYLDKGINVSLVSEKGDIVLQSKITKHTNLGNNSLNIINLGTGAIVMSNAFEIKSNVGALDILMQTNGNIQQDKNSKLISNGGLIRLQAFKKSNKLKKSPEHQIELFGLVNASSNTLGGKIIVESDEIYLHETTKLYAKGWNGGGTILIGGDWQGGKDKSKKEFEDIYEAMSVQMDHGAIVDASALHNGNGGKIVLWSNLNQPNSNTKAEGQLFAMAKGSGKGGMIETSGGAVNFSKIKVSTISADGNAGEWLLDPYNFYFTQTDLNTLSTNLATNNISISTANSSNANASSSNSFYGKGHIAFQGNLNYTGSNARTLSITSNADIWLNGSIGSSSGALTLNFDAVNRLLVNGSISSNGGAINFLNNTKVHFQQTSGTQNISSNGGAINLNSPNVYLLRHNGSVDINSGSGAMNFTAAGTFEQINTFYQISGPTRLLTGWGGAHAGGEKSYGINIVAGREYTTRMYYFDSWDGEAGELYVKESNGTNRYYFYANRTYNSGALTSISANFSTIYSVSGVSSMGRSGYDDLYVDITFVAEHSGTLYTYTNLNQNTDDESLELYDVWETQFPTENYATGSRSLNLISTSGTINAGTKNFTSLNNLNINTNNDLGVLNGNISGTTNVIKSGTGKFSITQNNSFSGNTTINDGTLVLQNNAPNPTNKTFNGTGKLIIEPISTSFTSPFSTSGWSFNSTLTGLTLGKTGNTANVTCGSALSINGAITMYGGQVDIQQNVTAAGAVLLKSNVTDVLISGTITNNSTTSTSLTVESLRNIKIAMNATISASTSAMNTQLWADNDKNGDGIVCIESSEINTRGGNLTIGKNGETAVISGSTVRVGGDLYLQRSTAQTITTLGGAVNIYGETIIANTAGLSINSSDGNVNLYGVLNSGNQYTLVINHAGITWVNAKNAANSGTGNLIGSTYLATITSRLENTIASQAAYYNPSWLGGRRVLGIGTDNLWRWTTGPEGLMDSGNGLAFSIQATTGGGTPSNNYFNNWNINEPNNWTGSTAGPLNSEFESALQFTGNQGKWNDLPFNNNPMYYYVVETNSASSPLTINSGTGTVAIDGSVGQSKELATLNVTSGGTTINGTGIITTGTQTYNSSLTVNNSSSTSQVLLKAGGTGITSSGNQNIYGGTITLDANLTATSGNILLDANRASQLTYTGDGVTINANKIVTADNGSITLSGRGGNGTANQRGVLLNPGSQLKTTSGAISITGIGGLSSGGGNMGVQLGTSSNPNAQITTTGGAINITGTPAGVGASSNNEGISVQLFNCTSGSGAITLNGGAAHNSVSSESIAFESGSVFGHASTQTGPITFIGDVFWISSAAPARQALTSGAVVFESNANIFSSGFTLTNFTLASNTSSLRIGKSTNTADITINSTINIAGPITAYGGTINLNSDLTTTNNGSISLYTDNAIAGLTALRTVTAAGSFNYLPQSNSFNATVTYPITNLNVSSAGLLIGKPTNEANVTFANATTIAGPITAYGGTITLDANLTTTNNGSISLYTDNALGGITSGRTLTAAGAFKYIPRTTTFSADVTYPIPNLTSTSTGLTIGNATNTKNITVNQAVTGAAGIELYGNNLNINANLKTTSSGDMYFKGNATIASLNYIESGGNFTHNGNLVFKSAANGSAAFGRLGGTYTKVSGTVTVERYIAQGRRAFRLVAPGVTTTNFIKNNWQLATHITGSTTGANGFDITATGNPSMYTYSNQVGTGTGWTAIANTDATNLEAEKGYRLLVRGDRTPTLITTSSADNMNTAITLSATGTLKTGTVTIHASSTPTAINNTNNTTTNGFSLVANPYVSPIDWDLVTKTGLTDTYYVWDTNLGTAAQRGRYVSYNLSDNLNSYGNTGVSNVNRYIQAGQAFFVKNTTLGTAGTLTFNESNKSLTSPFVLRTNNQNTLLSVLLYAPTELALGGYPIDGITTVFGSDFDNQIGNGDVPKLESAGENLAWFAQSKKLDINAQAPVVASDVLMIKSLRLGANKSYTFRIKATNFDTSLTGFLVDTYLNTQQAIDMSQDYFATFSTTSDALSFGEDRFKIVFSTSLNNDSFESKGLTIYPNPVVDSQFSIQLPASVSGKLVVKIHNALGQEIYQTQTDATNTLLVNPKQALATGVYIVSVNCDGKEYKQKIMVK